MLSIPPHALPPPIDGERLEEATGGDAEFTAELLTAFVDDSATRLALLAQAVSDRRMDAVAAEAHTIKGSSANVGASRMQQLASRIEAAARRADVADLDADTAKLQLELARVKSSR